MGGSFGGRVGVGVGAFDRRGGNSGAGSGGGGLPFPAATDEFPKGGGGVEGIGGGCTCRVDGAAAAAEEECDGVPPVEERDDGSSKLLSSCDGESHEGNV